MLPTPERVYWRHLGVRMFRFNNASLTIFLASVVGTSMGCGGGYNSSSQGSNPDSNQNGFDLTVYAHSVPSIPVNGTVDVQASGYYGPNHDYRALTDTATWSTSNTSVATVDKGRVSGIGVRFSRNHCCIRRQEWLDNRRRRAHADHEHRPTCHELQLVCSPAAAVCRASHLFGPHNVGPHALVNLEFKRKGSPGVPDDPYGLYPGLATLLTTGTATVAATEPSGETGSLDVTVVP